MMMMPVVVSGGGCRREWGNVSRSAVDRACRRASTIHRALSSSSSAAAATQPQTATRFVRPLVLGIETSCDDTCAAVVDARGVVLGEARRSQHHIHVEYGGVVPNLAMEAHVQAIDAVVAQALSEARRALGEEASTIAAHGGGAADARESTNGGHHDNQSVAGVIDAVAATVGPGLVLCLRVGVSKARCVAAEYGLPFIPVHHMEAHALVARADETSRASASFPFVALLVSGGHNMLVLARGLGRYTVLGTTLDDAAGEAFDKTARLLELDVSSGGGPAVEQLAKHGDPRALAFPVPLRRSRTKAKTCDFSFAGLKTAVRMYMERVHAERSDDGDVQLRIKADVAASFQHAAVAHLRERTARAVKWAKDMEPGVNCLMVSGGVASNESVRTALQEVADAAGLPLVCPAPSLCTDNGVMVAWTGQERLAAGLAEPAPPIEEVARFQEDPKSVRFQLRPRWPIGNADERSAHGLRSQKTAGIADPLTTSAERLATADSF